MFLKAMKQENISEGSIVITEGEIGDKLYIVQSGRLEVSISGQYIREMSEGAMFGELALLYDAPRSATVKCLTPCVMWSLSRELFKHIQAVSASATLLQRSRWLINSPELAVLTPIDLSRLVGALKTQLYDVGDNLYKENELSKKCLLIEKGVASILVPDDMSHLDAKSIDKALGIIRPPGVFISHHYITMIPSNNTAYLLKVDVVAQLV
jgi:cAMP-dependent protein kinase regulator